MLASIISGVIAPVLDKVIPDAAARDAAKIKLIELEQAGAFHELDQRMAAIVAEAQSSDPWTSRARPTFLYVMYALILASLPMGLFYIFAPEEAGRVITGMRLWLDGIPGELYTLFGVGYLGYVNKRSEEKQAQMGYEPKQGLMSRVLG